MTKNAQNVKEVEKKLSENDQQSPTSRANNVVASEHQPFSFVEKFEELRLALLEYGEHKHECIAWHVAEGCTCGLDNIRDKYDYHSHPKDDRLPWGMVAIGKCVIP